MFTLTFIIPIINCIFDFFFHYFSLFLELLSKNLSKQMKFTKKLFGNKSIDGSIVPPKFPKGKFALIRDWNLSIDILK